MRVKITSYDDRQNWYSELVGEVFEVVDRGADFVLKEDYDRAGPWRHISKHNCEEVE